MDKNGNYKEIIEELKAYNNGDMSVVSSIRKRQYTPPPKRGLSRFFDGKKIAAFFADIFRPRRVPRVNNGVR